ncbi:hypothetical protein CYLTODRAFT_219748 [Cylindrobasidium torrendii FP15055 ss-10]|uniref:Uncharacterized protein n=1 Tax=Cylindrobasidium torrendii FP15055 ss-10 TaxID=1314674 RepID=A0A0D7BT28_9AGAR|nr:hypothetical protein CYLTODRAFT_219748 [Cylindrobasidium torrendii FP15055 ss-10]
MTIAALAQAMTLGAEAHCCYPGRYFGAQLLPSLCLRNRDHLFSTFRTTTTTMSLTPPSAMDLPSTRPLFGQIHLFFNGPVTMSAEALRALAYHELASAALESEGGCSEPSSAALDSNDDTLCEPPLTRAHLHSFTFTKHKALVGQQSFFVISKHFAYPGPGIRKSDFLAAEPWLSSTSRCIGCGVLVDSDSPCAEWLVHRDMCTGIEDRMLQSAFVQTEAGEIVKDREEDQHPRPTVSREQMVHNFVFDDEDTFVTPEKMAQIRRRVGRWLRTVDPESPS